jgi:multidrug transporter EmrE-like cation transporter
MNLNYIYVFATLLLTVYGQLIVKWRVGEAGHFPATTSERISWLLGLVLDPWVISAFIGAFLAALSWMAALTKFELSRAYPFMALSFILVLILSGVFFNEPVTGAKVAGIALITAGLVVGTAL